jgi:hypothetical protein
MHISFDKILGVVLPDAQARYAFQDRVRLRAVCTRLSDDDAFSLPELMAFLRVTGHVVEKRPDNFISFAVSTPDQQSGDEESTMLFQQFVDHLFAVLERSSTTAEVGTVPKAVSLLVEFGCREMWSRHTATPVGNGASSDGADRMQLRSGLVTFLKLLDSSDTTVSGAALYHLTRMLRLGDTSSGGADAQGTQIYKGLVAPDVTYRCDSCDASPLLGTRWHCKECEDFDLCNDCYHRIHEGSATTQVSK